MTTESNPDGQGSESTVCTEQGHDMGTIGHQTFQEGIAGSNQAVEVQVQGGRLWRGWGGPPRGQQFKDQSSVPCKETSKNKKKTP